MFEDPLAPGFEGIGVAEMWELAPGGHERVLQRVLGEVAVAKDPMRDCVKPVADLMHQRCERVGVPGLGSFDEFTIHSISCQAAPHRPRAMTMSVPASKTFNQLRINLPGWPGGRRLNVWSAQPLITRIVGQSGKGAPSPTSPAVSGTVTPTFIRPSRAARPGSRG